MSESDSAAIAPKSQGYLISRAQYLADGGSNSRIQTRVSSGQWIRRQAGVYQVDSRDQSWRERLWAAVLAAGDGALVSHRAAIVLYGLDGIARAPVEITVGYSNRPAPAGVIVHRTRRPRDESSVQGIPATTVERTLLDSAAVIPPSVLVRAVDSAIRLRLTTFDAMYECLALRGSRGVRGVGKLTRVLAEYTEDVASGSPAESVILHRMRAEGVPEPELQFELTTGSGRRALPDFYWPGLAKAVEIDGLGTHASAKALDDDLQRQNELMALGVELRRFTARRVRRDPAGVVSEIRTFLGL